MTGLFRSMHAYAKVIAYMTRVFIQLLHGIWRLSQLAKAPVTIFGGRLLETDSIYMKQAAQLAQLLADNGYPVLTGGGPGIMEAAACGVFDQKSVVTAIGISVVGLDTGKDRSECYRDVIVMDNFSSRKYLLTRYSVGFAVFPGGFGTLDELAEVLTLIQTQKLKKAPIVLIGTDYWQPFIDWIFGCVLKHGLISKEDSALFCVTDDVQEAFKLLVAIQPPPDTSE